MKLMIASDIHGSAYYCRLLLEAFRREQADRLLLLENRRLAYDGPPQGLAAVDSVLNAATGAEAVSAAGEVPA